ncbi:hypothetical protein CSV77_15660 [Sporosarcina sp. P16b]|uniref:hypothetical protein n=1 Tax=Sporosarcina sp. P16b TaxID=2048261 RepID=UPI000C16B78E|nr:hypothetical protein [Sporosarcina sp. P16b]PIC69060.1 hypothetical protein CSV77_15660 [Sporosarcina sp. P16b]
MEKIELRSGLIDNDTENIKITIESEIIDKKKMILKAIELILSSTKEEDEDLEFFEDALLTLVDHVGYKFYYWNQVEKNEKS